MNNGLGPKDLVEIMGADLGVPSDILNKIATSAGQSERDWINLIGQAREMIDAGADPTAVEATLFALLEYASAPGISSAVLVHAIVRSAQLANQAPAMAFSR